jgi:hypothetical protein
MLARLRFDDLPPNVKAVLRGTVKTPDLPPKPKPDAPRAP